MADTKFKNGLTFHEVYDNVLEINVRSQEIAFSKEANKQAGWFTLSESCSREEYLFFCAYFKARGLPFRKHNLVECVEECRKILSNLIDHNIELTQKYVEEMYDLEDIGFVKKQDSLTEDK